MASQTESSSTVTPATSLADARSDPVNVGHLRSPRLLTWMTALVWLIPLLLLAVAAWQTWDREIGETDNEIQNVLTVLAEHTEQVFQSHAVTLEWVDKRIKGWTWEEIERSVELHDFIANLDNGSDYMDSVFLVDRDGRIRATDRRFPARAPATYVGDRDYFVAAQNGTANAIYIGRLELGRGSRGLSFRVARRRSTADGSFDGIIVVRLSANYFEQFFGKIIETTAGAITISRDDGAILARNATVARGPAGPSDSQPKSDFAMFQSGEARMFTSTVDGVKRFGAVRKLRNYPVIVAYAVDMQTLREEWVDRLSPFAIVAVSSSLVLFLLSLYAQRVARSERIAQLGWQEEVRDRLRREAQVRRALRMEALGRMAGGIAHHFNNLLPAMSGLLEMTRAEVPAGSSAAKRLERMISAVDEGRDVVRRILTFSHRDMARQDRIGMSVLVDDAIALAEGNLPRNIRLVPDQKYDGDIIGDPSQLNDVLLDLIANAAHAIGAREGVITLSTEIYLVDGEAAQRLAVRVGRYVRIECIDNGIGMSDDVQEHAFEPFFTTKPRGEGFGLGLAIVHGVIIGHGGAIEVHSESGMGSRFSIYLPGLPPD